MNKNCICPENDWGCVPDDELFFNAGPTPSFDTLMRQFIIKMRREEQKYKEELNENNYQIEEEEFEENNKTVKDVVVDEFLPLRIESDDEIIIKDDVEDKLTENLFVEKNKSTGILKKQQKQNSLDSPINHKRVTFEIERFVASKISDGKEKLTAQQKLIQKLGGKPAKKSFINYKQLKNKKEEIKNKKEEKEFEENNNNIKISGIKRKKGAKNKNLKGRIKKQKRSKR